MSALRTLSETNPALIVAAAAAAYATVWWLRRYYKTGLLVAWVAICGLFVLTPSGREAVDLAAAQKRPADRVSCLTVAVMDGAPIRRAAAARSSRCRNPSPVRSVTAAGQRTFDRNATQLKEQYR